MRRSEVTIDKKPFLKSGREHFTVGEMPGAPPEVWHFKFYVNTTVIDLADETECKTSSSDKE